MIVIFGHGESCHAAHYFSQFLSIFTESNILRTSPYREGTSSKHFEQTAKLNLGIKRTGEAQRVVLLKDLPVSLKDRLLGFHSIRR